MVRRMGVAAALVWGVLAAWPAATTAAEETSAQAFARGQALLAKGDLAGGHGALLIAAKMEPDNAQYRQQYALVRRVLRMQKALTSAPDAEDWVTTARGVRAFYEELGLYREMLPLDRQINVREGTTASAVALAETQLALGMNKQTEVLLDRLPVAKQTALTEALRAIAAARMGDERAAKKALDDIVLAKDAGAEEHYAIARLCALAGNHDRAATELAKALELTPPVRLEITRRAARACPDLAGMAGSELLAKALATESKVKVSSCSGGTSCGKCPSALTCTKAAGSSTGAFPPTCQKKDQP